MEYPLVIDGVKEGSMSVEQSGLYTVFEAQYPKSCEGLLRLWVHGGGECAYFGVMQPWSGGLYLRRRLSRAELAHFPKQIEFASNSGAAIEPEKEAEPEEKLPETETEADAAQEEEETKTENKAGPEQTAEPEPEEDAYINACPYPAPVPENSEELLWFRRSDGTLTAFDGISSLVAIPAELRRGKKEAVIRKLDGRDYMIFRY